ncbi:MAG: TolC family protein [Verrucomicrobiia bacterium]
MEKSDTIAMIVIGVFTAFFAARVYGAAEAVVNTNAPGVVEPEQIIRKALRYSIELKSLERERNVAEAQFEQARAQAYPQIGADAKYTRYAGLNSFAIPPYLTIPDIEDRYNIGATMTQPIYTGGKLKGLRQSAELLKSSVGEQKRSAELAIVYQVLELYWNWSKAYHQLQALDIAVKRMESHTKDIKNLRQAGMATDNDALATEVMLEQTRLRYEEAKRRLEMICANIALVTGEKFLVDQIPAKPDVVESVKIPSEDELLRVARQMRPERAARIYETQALDERVKVAQSEYYPQVSIVARYEQAMPNMLNFPPRERWQDDAFAGVVVSWNIFDWGVRAAKVKEASARRDQSHLRLERLDDQILYEIRSARIRLMEAYERLGVSRRLVASAEKNLKVATDLWKNGLARHSDVLDAHWQLTDAQFAIISDSADVKVALAAMHYACGRLGEYVNFSKAKE